MSAPVVAITSLLLDVLSRMQDRAELTAAEQAFFDLFRPRVQDIAQLKHHATREMQGLAPALLAQDDAA
jgi:hypothetical protein